MRRRRWRPCGWPARGGRPGGPAWPRPDLRPADRHAVDADGRQPDADRDGLTVLAAGAHALVELEVVAHAAHAGERFGSVADEGRTLDRAGDAPVLHPGGPAPRDA